MLNLYQADLWFKMGFKFPITDRVMMAIENRNSQIDKLTKLERQLKQHRKDFPIFCSIYDQDAEPTRDFYRVSKERALLIAQIQGLRKGLKYA